MLEIAQSPNAKPVLDRPMFPTGPQLRQEGPWSDFPDPGATHPSSSKQTALYGAPEPVRKASGNRPSEIADLGGAASVTSEFRKR
jgi:hypothetical protein